jgi:hypothetical protein
MPTESTTIQRIETPGLEIKQDREFDYGQRLKVSPELEKAIGESCARISVHTSRRD